MPSIFQSQRIDRVCLRHWEQVRFGTLRRFNEGRNAGGLWYWVELVFVPLRLVR